MVKRVKKGVFLRFLGRIFTQIEHTFFSLKLGEQTHLSTKGRKNWSILSPLNNLYKLNKTDLPKIRKCLVKWVTVFKPPKTPVLLYGIGWSRHEYKLELSLVRVSKRGQSGNRWNGRRTVPDMPGRIVVSSTAQRRYREVIQYSGYIWNGNNTETEADHFNVKCCEITTFIKKKVGKFS